MKTFETGEPLPEVPPHYFDISTGQLLIGQLALTAHIEAGNDLRDISLLAELLQSKSLPCEVQVPLDVEDWVLPDYEANGVWLQSVVENRLSKRILKNAFKLGLGASVQRMEHPSRYGSLANFYVAAGTEHWYRRGIYDDWSFTKVLGYMREVIAECLETSIKPTREVFQAWARNGKGPSIDVIKRLAGHPVGHILTEMGFPDSRYMERQDFIDWGVKFMFANEGKPPRVPAINYLAQHKRGPGKVSIYNHFKSFPNYQQEVLKAYDAEFEARQAIREQKLWQIKADLEDGNLPASIFENSVSEDEAIQLSTRYNLVVKLLPGRTTRLYYKMARASKPEKLVRLVQHEDDTISAAKIETTALMLDVFDDIWPMDDYLRTLKVA